MSGVIERLDPRGHGVWRLPFPPVAQLLLAAAWLLLFASRGGWRGWFWVVDGANLLIHEAGHPIFGVLGIRFLMMLGGTLMQLAMPAAFCIHFLRHDQPRSADVCLFWIGLNLLHIGRYAADARAQELPLVGSGEHDWTYLLDAVGLLRFDLPVGAVIDAAGCALMALSGYALWSRHLRRDAPQGKLPL